MTKKERFHKIAVARTQTVLDDMNLLSYCSRTAKTIAITLLSLLVKYAAMNLKELATWVGNSPYFSVSARICPLYTKNRRSRSLRTTVP